jgi:hypothetical protein
MIKLSTIIGKQKNHKYWSSIMYYILLAGGVLDNRTSLVRYNIKTLILLIILLLQISDEVKHV